MRSEGLRLPLLLGAAAVMLALLHTGEVRDRAELALERGMPPREAALARGFVLGQDERIDAATREDFERAGLSHLLAVSGQNVALLALLAMPLLAALGMSLRTRLVWILGLIAVYVPLAGAGPPLQRAAIMGALSLLATLAGRRAPRLYALLLAAAVLLALDPAIAADVGWQLSFAAVLGILLLSPALRDSIGAWLGMPGWRRPLVEGAAMTVAATLATAPLVAFHFGTVSTTSLLANLLALPAVAPAMWLGMLAAAAGQVPALPVEALNAANAMLLAYVAQVAAWCGRPNWSVLHLRPGPAELVVAYVAIAAVSALALRGRRGLALTATLALLPLALALATPAAGGAGPPDGLRVSVLDVGQGDSILLQPRGGDALLVDGGPHGGGLAAKLRAAGVERLGAAVITHDQADHAGGIAELFGGIPVGRLLYGALGRETLAEAAGASVEAQAISSGNVLRSGGLSLEVLWPPAELLATTDRGDDPNRLALVMLARWRDFSMLLTADAEAEAAPLDPGPVDVLKVAHHGSEDAGLAGLLERTGPRLAVISAGSDNPFGHPTPTTLTTLAAHGVPTLRTDQAGTVVLEVERGSVRVHGGG